MQHVANAVMRDPEAALQGKMGPEAQRMALHAALAGELGPEAQRRAIGLVNQQQQQAQQQMPSGIFMPQAPQAGGGILQAGA